MSLAKKISNAELEVMKILWKKGEPVSSAEIRQELQEMNWEKSTVLTLLRRLADKEVVKTEKLEALYYTPNISEAEYVEYQTEDMIDKLYGGSAKSLVAALYDDKKLSEADIIELRNYFMGEVGK